MKSFLIHHSNCKERDGYVKTIVEKTNALVIDPVWCPYFPTLGCILSHIKVARLGEGGYYVFEDDCEIVEDFLNIPLDYDIIYFGINGKAFQRRPIECMHYWGTHALYISERARKILIDNWEKELEVLYPKGFPAIDEILSVLIVRHSLSFKIYDSVRQAKGLVSSISGTVRK